MRIVALANPKGGVGKTACAIHLGCAAIADGATVAVLDLDPQASTKNWAARRNADGQLLEAPLVAACDVIKLDSTLASLRKAGVAWVFLDTPGRSTPIMSAALVAAHAILIPTRPWDIDLEASHDVVAAAIRLRKKYWFLMSIAPPGRSTRTQDTMAALRAAKHKVCDVVIHQRMAVADAISDGKGVTESDPRGAAASEFRRLMSWIEDEIA